MASEFHRLLDPQAISDSKTQDREQWFDAGAYKQLNVELYLLATGVTSPASQSFKLTVQHAAVPEDDAFVDLKDQAGTAVEVEMVDGASVGNTYHQVEGFLRYIRWIAKTANTVTSAPVAGIDLVGKE